MAHPPRARAAASSLAFVALLALVLASGLAVKRSATAPATLVAVDLSPPRPQATPKPPPEKRREKSAAAKGNPSPRNLRNKATQVVAPRAPLLIEPPPIVAATHAGVGSAANTGASDRLGPGQGAGGIGNGDGGGGSGGNGDGDGGGAVVGPGRVAGRLTYDDLPMGVLSLGEEATVEVRYTVTAAGRAIRCRAVRSSGYSLLDTLACQLIEQRFRFRPARDRLGRPTAADVIERHTWVEDGEAPDDYR